MFLLAGDLIDDERLAKQSSWLSNQTLCVSLYPLSWQHRNGGEVNNLIDRSTGKSCKTWDCTKDTDLCLLLLTCQSTRTKYDYFGQVKLFSSTLWNQSRTGSMGNSFLCLFVSLFFPQDGNTRVALLLEYFSFAFSRGYLFIFYFFIFSFMLYWHFELLRGKTNVVNTRQPKRWQNLQINTFFIQECRNIQKCDSKICVKYPLILIQHPPDGMKTIF